jgi:hypothetical protein|tara:strand:+ start:338 stop:871 length:534 start_codon:yes stop_codon:yes gene_type:complete
MSDIDNMLSGSDTATYSPSDEEYVIVSEGEYPAHIVDLRVISTQIRKTGNKCEIFKPVYEIAKEASDFAGRKVNSNGVFRYHNPPSEDGKQPTTGNRYYKNFLDVVGVSMREDKDPNTGRVTYSLPKVEKDDVYGVPVMIRVKHRPYEYQGNQRTAADGILVSAWGDGKKLEMEIPF